MLNRSASLAMSTSVLKALPGKLDIKRHSPSILCLFSETLQCDPHLVHDQFSLHVWHLIAKRCVTQQRSTDDRFIESYTICKYTAKMFKGTHDDFP